VESYSSRGMPTRAASNGVQPSTRNHKTEGVSIGVNGHWYRFDKSKRHITLPYTGFRVSVVYFSVPTDRCDIADLARLQHLGFRVPNASPFGVPLPWPYHVFICTTRRCNTIENDKMSTLFADRSVPPYAIALCVRGEDDAQLYRKLGLRMLVSKDGSGLPDQRRCCTGCLPAGSWCLYLDDDVTRIEKPEYLTMHELIMVGFLTAQQRHVHLWGLNTSTDRRNLCESHSGQPGLICGYFFGLITAPVMNGATCTSDAVGVQAKTWRGVYGTTRTLASCA